MSIANDFKGFIVSVNECVIDSLTRSLPNSATATNEGGTLYIDLEDCEEMGWASAELEEIIETNKVPEDTKILLLF